jgi:hypothetical protein
LTYGEAIWGSWGSTGSILQLINLVKSDPSGFLKQLWKMPLNKFFESISYKQIMGCACLLIISMSVQLKFSNRARQWIKSLIHGITFGSNFFALLLCGLLAALKWRMSRTPKKKITNYGSGYEEDESSNAD